MHALARPPAGQPVVYVDGRTFSSLTRLIAQLVPLKHCYRYKPRSSRTARGRSGPSARSSFQFS